MWPRRTCRFILKTRPSDELGVVTGPAGRDLRRLNVETSHVSDWLGIDQTLSPGVVAAVEANTDIE